MKIKDKKIKEAITGYYKAKTILEKVTKGESRLNLSNAALGRAEYWSGKISGLKDAFGILGISYRKKRVCPKCNTEITSLLSVARGELMRYINLDRQGDIHYEEVEFDPDNDVTEYLCPECDETLFLEESEATAFLKGEALLPEGE